MLLAGVLLLPFLGKAFTIDDTVFLRQAEYALTDPLHPSALVMVWSEVARPMRLSQVMPTGPLMAWILMPVALAGGSEAVAHLIQLALLLFAIFETSVLSLRLGLDEDGARIASLVLASTPAVLGMSGTVMPDIAAMALAVAGVERLCAWQEDRRWHQALAAGAALALAPLARSHVLLLVGLAPFILGMPRLSQWKAWIPVVAAPLGFLALLRLTADPGGDAGNIAQAAGMFSSLGNVRSNVLALGTHMMLVLPLGIVWTASAGWRFWRSVLPWLGIAAAAAMFFYGGQTRWLWLAPVTGLGLAVLVDVVRDAALRREAVRVLLALWMLIALPIVVYLHFPSKYLVPCAPAAAIAAALALAETARRRQLAVAGAVIAAGSVLGVLILQADSSLADLGRRAAEDLVRPHVQAGEHVWFTTHWGFQWYAERAGARPVTTTPPHPAPGDLVVSSEVTITGVSISGFRSRELVDSVTDASPGGRVISSEAGAGFYSNGWGYLPWAWSSRPVDRFELWRLR